MSAGPSLCSHPDVLLGAHILRPARVLPLKPRPSLAVAVWTVDEIRLRSQLIQRCYHHDFVAPIAVGVNPALTWGAHDVLHRRLLQVMAVMGRSMAAMPLCPKVRRW